MQISNNATYKTPMQRRKEEADKAFLARSKAASSVGNRYTEEALRTAAVAGDDVAFRTMAFELNREKFAN